MKKKMLGRYYYIALALAVVLLVWVVVGYTRVSKRLARLECDHKYYTQDEIKGLDREAHYISTFCTFTCDGCGATYERRGELNNPGGVKFGKEL